MRRASLSQWGLSALPKGVSTHPEMAINHQQSSVGTEKSCSITLFNPKITPLSCIGRLGYFGYPQRTRRCSWLNGWLGISWWDSLWLSGEKLNVSSDLFKRIKIAGVLLIVYFLCHFIFLCFSLLIHYTPKNFLLKLCFRLILYILNDFLFFNSFY